MIVSAHQPAYLPWLGYFEKIARADVFVHCDSVQFERHSFINRNKIKTQHGELWLTIPVKLENHHFSEFRDIEINRTSLWVKKHLRSIFINYKKAPRFDIVYEKIVDLFMQDELTQNLDGVLWRQLQFWLDELKITTPIVRLSSLDLGEFKKSDLVLEICKKLKATKFISGALGRDYLDLKAFANHGIEVEFQSFVSPVYNQLWNDFIPNLSIIDYLMHEENYVFEKSNLLGDKIRNNESCL